MNRTANIKPHELLLVGTNSQSIENQPLDTNIISLVAHASSSYQETSTCTCLAENEQTFTRHLTARLVPQQEHPFEASLHSME